jgi:hypothetical protein
MAPTGAAATPADPELSGTVEQKQKTMFNAAVRVSAKKFILWHEKIYEIKGKL